MSNYELVKTLNSMFKFDIKSVQQLNKILEAMGIIVKTGNGWLQTDYGVKFSQYSCKFFRANEWKSDLIPQIALYLQKLR